MYLTLPQQSRRGLGDLTDTLTSLSAPTDTGMSTLWMAGLGILGLALLLSFVKKKAGSFQRKRRQSRARKQARRARIQSLKSELKSLGA